MVKLSSKHLILKQLDNRVASVSSYPVIVIVPKKFVKLAVNRNKIKRRLRHIFTEGLSLKNKKLKGIVYVKKGISDLSYLDLKKEALEILSSVN